MREHFSASDLVIIGATIILFIVALFVKGMTHDLLLEAGVLLVSIKLIMMNHKNASTNKVILKDLDEVKKTLAELKNTNS